MINCIKAFERSINITPTYSRLSKEAFHFSSILISLYCVLWFFSKSTQLDWKFIFFEIINLLIYKSLKNLCHMWQNAQWPIIFLIERIIFLENWDYISTFKLFRKFILLKRKVDDLREYWKVGVNRPLKQFTGISPSLVAFFVVKI